MGFINIYRCAGIEFDIYDIERVSNEYTQSKYYITPSRLIAAQKWMLENEIDEIIFEEQMQQLIDKDIIGTY
jgi:hypothetical protein